MKRYRRDVLMFLRRVRVPWIIIEMGLLAAAALGVTAATEFVGTEGLTRVAVLLAGIIAGYFIGVVSVYWHAERLHKKWAERLKKVVE